MLEIVLGYNLQKYQMVFGIVIIVGGYEMFLKMDQQPYDKK
jgi:hypothetical protein